MEHGIGDVVDAASPLQECLDKVVTGLRSGQFETCAVFLSRAAGLAKTLEEAVLGSPATKGLAAR
jgi:hypothetical protein